MRTTQTYKLVCVTYEERIVPRHLFVSFPNDDEMGRKKKKRGKREEEEKKERRQGIKKIEI